MKKLMIALAVAAVAVASQAANFKWTTSESLKGVDVTSDLAGNGTYTDLGSILKNNNTSLNVTLTMFTADGLTQLGTATKKVAYSYTSGQTDWVSTTFSSFPGSYTGNTDYKYVITVTGDQSDLKALTNYKGYDYSAATISTTMEGTYTTTAMSTQTINVNPTKWTINGAVAVPEPTSGLLLLLGVAGLALRRRRA